MYKIIIGKNKFPTLVAKTPEEHERGLMYRTWPPPAMCFPYKIAAWRKFWMKNTISPLDIIFCKGGKIVSIHKGEPLSTEMVGPNEPTDFVVELPHGYVKAFGIDVGQNVKLKIDYNEIKIIADKYRERIKVLTP